MSANERLQAMQSALIGRGVKDVKFCFALGLDSMPKSVVENGVADFLAAFLDGRSTPLKNIDGEPPVPEYVSLPAV